MTPNQISETPLISTCPASNPSGFLKNPLRVTTLYFWLFCGVSLFSLHSPLSVRSSFAATSVTLNQLEASVNATPILTSDIAAFRKTAPLRAQLDPLFAGSELASKGQSIEDQEIREFLIREKLIVQEFPAGDTEVEQEISLIQSKNGMSREQLRSTLGEQGYAFGDYFELIRIGISKRSLIDRDIRSKVAPSDADVKNYFYNHYSRSNAAARAFHLQLITVPLADYRSPTDAYDASKRAYQAVKAGERFEDVAKRTNPDGSEGDLGILTDDQMHPLIREQARKLQIGECSPVFGGPGLGRYMILRLVDVKSSETDRYEKVREEIRAKLAADEFQHQINLWVERKIQSSFVHRAGETITQEIPAAR